MNELVRFRTQEGNTQTNKRTNEQTNYLDYVPYARRDHTNEQTNKRTYERRNKLVRFRTQEGNTQTNKRSNEQTNKRNAKVTNDFIRKNCRWPRFTYFCVRHQESTVHCSNNKIPKFNFLNYNYSNYNYSNYNYSNYIYSNYNYLNSKCLFK